MSLREWESLGVMNDSTQASTTISNIGVAMFTITDQDAAIAYYTQTLGWELRADVPLGVATASVHLATLSISRG